MPALTDEGRRIVDDLANRHGFSKDATEHMLVCVFNGNGQMAQFSHPEFGGSGQWMRGGMTMIGDMFNNHLKGRVDCLCAEIASVLQSRGGVLQSGSFQSQTQGGLNSQRQEVGGLHGESSLFVPDPSQNWWPQEFGHPSATGSQNQTQYAYFSVPRRLAVKTGNSVWVYDTQDHQIGGFSQQQSGSGTITFSSQFGTVDLGSLVVVMRDGQNIVPAPPAAPPTLASETPSSADSAPATSFPQSASASVEADIFKTIERLGDLKVKGLLTDVEFDEKKKELLARL